DVAGTARIGAVAGGAIRGIGGAAGGDGSVAVLRVLLCAGVGGRVVEWTGRREGERRYEGGPDKALSHGTQHGVTPFVRSAPSPNPLPQRWSRWGRGRIS